MDVISAVRLDELSKLDPSTLPTEFRLFKWGDNTTSKGTFKLDNAGAESLMAAYAKRGVELYLDYEHGTFEAGGSSKAAAWFVPQVRADGLWAANVRWTPPAAEELKNRQYRYFSPTFKADAEKRIVELLPAALTNYPATHGQEPLVAASVVALAEWSTAFMNDLPDSSFLYIEPGGKKDGDGKTTPRSLRHFPVKDASGKVDMPHLRNALSRIPQSSLPAAVKERAAAEARRMLGHQQRVSTKEANDRLSTRLAASFRLVTGMRARKRSAL